MLEAEPHCHSLPEFVRAGKIQGNALTGWARKGHWNDGILDALTSGRRREAST